MSRDILLRRCPEAGIPAVSGVLVFPESFIPTVARVSVFLLLKRTFEIAEHILRIGGPGAKALFFWAPLVSFGRGSRERSHAEFASLGVGLSRYAVF
jgi:hypothetical protein